MQRVSHDAIVTARHRSENASYMVLNVSLCARYERRGAIRLDARAIQFVRFNFSVDNF